jgi:hypothetical protein
VLFGTNKFWQLVNRKFVLKKNAAESSWLPYGDLQEHKEKGTWYNCLQGCALIMSNTLFVPTNANYFNF